jgi:glycosyltransferase involved in cell wall biosynthesis
LKSDLISVVMSVFNAQDSLDDSILSILNQDYSNIELLLLDDSSTDESFKIIQKYKDLDSRVKTYRNSKNIGLTKSLNLLISKSSGRFLARQDADDVSLHQRLSKQLNVMKSKNVKICTTRAYVKNSNKKIPGISNFLPSKLLIKYKNPFIHGTLMIEKSLMEKYQCYNESFKLAQDYELFYRMLNNGEKIIKLKEPLYILNMENNISTIQKDEQLKYAKLARDNQFYS